MVVSNSSALINPARIGKHELLRDLYGVVCIPEAVWQEAVVKGEGQAGASEIKSAPWIKAQGVKNAELVKALRQELDPGEAEAIALALETQAELLLMDERLGRDTARHLGLRFTGLIGLLVEAKRKGLIANIKGELDALRDVAGFRIADSLYRQILRDEKEA
jgi:predicted nucleic acid-binding protein